MILAGGYFIVFSAFLEGAPVATPVSDSNSITAKTNSQKDPGFWSLYYQHELSDTIEHYAQALAFAGAGLFFFAKFCAGYLLSNLSLSTRCKRVSGPDPLFDTLIVTVALEKGDRNTILLHDLQARVAYGDESVVLAFHDVERRSMKSEQHPPRQAIVWDLRSKKAPFLRLSPGEKTKFAVSCQVPKKCLCNVEVVVLAPRPFSRGVGQWRASEIVPPVSWQ